MEQMVIPDGIPTVPRNRKSRKSVPKPSAEEKTSRNSVPWNKNRSKLSEWFPNPSVLLHTWQTRIRQGTLNNYMIHFAVGFSEAALRRDNIFLGCRVASGVPRGDAQDARASGQPKMCIPPCKIRATYNSGRLKKNYFCIVEGNLYTF
jgi:hypothetical protein